ncbi:hypothetical protein BGZ63DRAFT_254837 [Mariannaea sp. PMI_226]|nr:hypothetical protein BGZ63DRAFT_254837 [Mariannaea sp. PMI_226]
MPSFRSTRHQVPSPTSPFAMNELVTHPGPDTQTAMLPKFGSGQAGGEITSFNHFPKEEAVALKDLKFWPRVINCPACMEPSITRVNSKMCTGTHVMAGFFLVCTVVGVVIPYVVKSFRDVEHYCCRCNRRLVTHHFATGTEIHVF